MTATAAPSVDSTPATLVRRLGLIDASAIVVSNVIGGGIFYVPVLVAALTTTAWAMIGVWTAGGLLAFAGAMAYAELATVRPHAGGEYVYIREAYGQLAAFLSGWTSFVAGFSGALAASAVALAGYLGRFIPAAADNHTSLLTLRLPYVPLVVTPQALVAIGVIAGVSLVHFHGSGRFVHNVLTGIKIVALGAFIALGLSIGRGSLDHLSSAHAVATPVTNWLLALVPVMFCYSGWNAATYVAEEIRDPSRNLPRSLALGTFAVVVVFLLLNLLYLFAMPLADLSALPDGRLTDMVAERLFGFVAGDLLAVFTIVSLAAGISAMVLAGPRIYYAMARDGVFFPAAARIHRTFRTPVLAIVAQALWTSVLILSGTLSGLVSYTGFGLIVFSGIAVLSVFVLRRREPTAHRPFKAVGYPIAPAIFVGASALMVVNEIWNQPGPSVAGLVVIVAGVPVYAWFALRMRTTTS